MNIHSSALIAVLTGEPAVSMLNSAIANAWVVRVARPGRLETSLVI